ncbi:MAG: hypothetical protein KatS3mg068_1752 [Candidatus Sericytochromatia bacterium]|nr:MAG: hypothetical protein KatS3mg068_1752 [Candidatus Sericytochromatia bacterium]
MANKKYKIKSAGIDIISNFIRISNIIKKNLNLQNIYFKNNDFFQENIKQYNLFFITATCFDDKTFNRLIDKLEQIKNNSKIAIVTKKVNKKKF